jgi:hypothetical protein
VAILKELSKCKLDLVGVQEIRWDTGGTELAEKYTCTFVYGKWNGSNELDPGFVVRKRIIPALRRV